VHKPTQETPKLVSIVMPVYNGERYISGSIRAVVKTLTRYGIPHEVVVVDDGSSDGTRSKALEVAAEHPNIKVVGHARNHGKGAAFLHGYRHSQGDVIVLFDADLDVPPQQIPVLLAVMRGARADVVITNKWHPLSRTRATAIRKFLSKSFNALVRLLTGLNISDTQTGAKAIKRYVLDAIAPKMYVKRYAFDVELLLLAAKHGYRIAEAPSLKTIKLTTAFRPREIFRMLLELLSIAYRHGRV